MERDLMEMETQLENVADALVGANESGVKAESIAEASAQIEELVENTENLEKGKKKLKGKVRARNVLIVLLVIIIILLLLKDFIFKSLDKEVVLPEFQSGEFVERTYDVPEAAPRVDIPVIMDFAVSPFYPYGTLFNPESNADKFHLVYSFTINGEEEPFYETKYIKAGDKFSVNFLDLLPAGEHEVTVRVKPYSVDTLEEKSGTVNGFKIKVSK